MEPSIDVQVRLSRVGAIQLFIGVYAASDQALYEEGIDCRRGESMTRALAWEAVKPGILARKVCRRHRCAPKPDPSTAWLAIGRVSALLIENIAMAMGQKV